MQFKARQPNSCEQPFITHSKHILRHPSTSMHMELHTSMWHKPTIAQLCLQPEEEWGSSHNALRLIIIHNYDFQRTFGEKLLKYIAILVPFISFFRRYVFIFVLFKTLIRP
jgi:hypothetical protein